MKTTVRDTIKRIHPLSLGKDLIITVLGMFVYSFGVHYFTAPNRIAPGGLTGLATIINALWKNMPIGGITLVFNIPIMIIGFIYLGKRFMFKTLFSLGSFTIFTDYLLKSFPVYTDDKLLASIFGGVLMGSGIGIMLSCGSSSGGMDIVNKLILKRFPHLKQGRLTFMTDLVVVSISAIAFQSVEPALYALIALYISSLALDAVLYGFNVCKFIYVMTDKADEISERVIKEMHRGATIMHSYGAFTKKERPTLMVAVRQNEYYKIKKIISSIDPAAFIIVTPATEIVGAGFNKMD